MDFVTHSFFNSINLDDPEIEESLIEELGRLYLRSSGDGGASLSPRLKLLVNANTLQRAMSYQ